MDALLLRVSYLSLIWIVLVGLLVILIIFWSKSKKSGFHSKRLDETSTLLTYEEMLKQGKISREEYNKIANALLSKHGFTETEQKNNETKKE